MHDWMNWAKGGITFLGAVLSARLGILAPIMLVLLIAMAMDFLTAWIRAGTTEEKLQSQKCSAGIRKKIGYLIYVGCGLIVDWLLLTVTGELGITVQVPAIFALMVAIWLILNELVSILENLDRAGIKTPAFLTAIVHKIKNTVDEKGDNIARKGEKDE